MTENNPSPWVLLLQQLLPMVQAVVAVILGYISKLLWDIRSEIKHLETRLSRAEVEQRAAAKLVETCVMDLRREQDLIHRRLERAEERHG